ncbi:ADP-ribosyl cyclase/cyclic ADP-ribose hydrolase [Elysia marginata]|uniref:ADP-ribosyl cyclase/cyclic ADP-ribose hydrolase n=1 Tax=Elysia marginata TaxID=1093978 RepID=A0AAV4HG45_9GAST|nr:ADP-ribosyl cyclase/cyclic ADP-ribose hydrolase [Elysia marginata]
MVMIRTRVFAVGILFLIMINTSIVVSQYDPEGHRGTTENIKEVFEGRCWDYDVTRYLPDLPRVDTGCETLWKLFFKAFSYQPPCAVALENYQPYLEEAAQALPKDKVLFWSSVFSLAHQYGDYGQRYVTLEDTLVGYLANSITWCGQSIEPGYNVTRCPAWDDCPLEAAESFWAGASKTFAQRAKGEVSLMLDGSNPEKPAYRRNSFFGKFELPNLTKDVTRVSVIVSHVLDKPKVEVCGEGSLLLLEADVKERGFSYVCKDDPLVVLHLLCASDPNSRECQLVVNHARGQLNSTKKDTPLLNEVPDFF